jgi:predicted lipoprotein with Yx(FWY)xxD motif
MFRTRATAGAFASFAAVGVLLLSACGGDNEGNAPAASPSSAGAIDMNFASGTAQQNNAAAKTGDWAAGAAPAAATSTPVIRKWVQLTAAKVGALNPVVVNGAGFTLYRFDKDSANPSVSNCSGTCATTWPPYLVARDGRVFLDGVDKSAIGVIPRDGAFQITIDGWPVYLFNKDTKPGDTNGQGVGGTWFGVTPDGQKAGQAADGTGSTALSASPTSTPASSVTVFQGANFADPAQGVGGPGCQNVTFSGSLQVSGFVKIWDGANCTGNSKFVEADVADLSAIGFPSVKSIRFFN